MRVWAHFQDQKNGIFNRFFDPVLLKKLQLLGRGRNIYSFMPPEDLHHAKLLVCNAQDTDMPFAGQYLLDPPDVDIRILLAAAVPQVQAELEHLEPVRQHILAKMGIVLPVLLGLGRQIEHDNHPHDTVRI